MDSPFTASTQTALGPSPVVKDQITVVETVYHRPAFGGDPFVSDSRFSRELGSFEQVYERKHLQAIEEWKRLDLGWIKSCGMLILQNEEGRFLQRNPSEEEQVRFRSKVLEVCIGESPDPGRSWLVPAGETIRVVPGSIEHLYLRCRTGRAYYTIRAFPS